jgi:hypothetical protein
VNPSLTIAALAEYAMSRVPPEEDKPSVIWEQENSIKTLWMERR